MRKNFLFIDGLIVPAHPSFTDKISPGRLPGKGVFETMRAYRGIIFAVSQHLQRLSAGLKMFNIERPYSTRRIEQLLYESLRSNRLANARIRLTVWADKSQVHTSIVTVPYKPYPATKYKRGFKAIISEIQRDERSQSSRVKSVKYLPFIRALRSAASKGCDEAILLNRKGEIVEGSRTNIFYIKEGCLYTPALKTGCLKGITRQIIINLAKREGIPVKMSTAKVEDILDAQEAFFSNSLIEIMPLTSIEGWSIQNGKAGPITKQLIDHYKQIVRTGTR